MVDIKPFRGIYFELKKAKPLKKLTCPPYDIISPKDQEHFYRLHPYNVVRLVLGKNRSTDSKDSNRNSRSGRYFQNWLKKGILEKETNPIIYIYRQRYTFRNKVYAPLGFMALSRLEDWRRKKVLPHEVTFDKFKIDRLKLLRRTKANFESILALYSHSARIEKVLKKAVKSPPFLKILDEDRVEHAIYRLSNKREIAMIQREMKKRPLFIADGHHRYQASLDFSREAARSKTSLKYKAAHYIMVTFMDMERSNLTIFPTHRLVGRLPRFSSKQFFESLEPCFQVKKVSAGNFHSQLKKEGKRFTAFGLYLGGDQYFLIKLKPQIDLRNLIKGNKSFAWKKLDVNVLHRLILEKLLNGGKDNRLYFTRDPKEARDEVKNGKSQMAFLLNPTRIDDIRSVASRGERMPPKSTYFYPKLRSGLIMREME